MTLAYIKIICNFEPESLADKTLSMQDKARLFIRHQIITYFYPY